MRTVRFPSPQHFFSANSQMHRADRPKKCGALRFYHHVFLLPLKKDFVPVRAKVLFLIPQASGNQLRLNALFYFIRYYRRNSGASRGIRTLDTWFRRPSNENDKLYEIQRIRYHRISFRSYAVPFSFRELSGRQLRPTLRPAISFPSHTGAPFRCA